MELETQRLIVLSLLALVRAQEHHNSYLTNADLVELAARRRQLEAWLTKNPAA